LLLLLQLWQETTISCFWLNTEIKQTTMATGTITPQNKGLNGQNNSGARALLEIFVHFLAVLYKTTT